MMDRKAKGYLIFLAGALAVLALNQLAYKFRVVWDFTEEKKYTLHPASVDILENLSEPITIEVFLEGELPSNFRRFRNAIAEQLGQISSIAAPNLQYKFSDPSIAESTNARNQFYSSLMERGLQASNISFTKNGEKTEKLVFPGAIVSFGGREIAVNLLKGNRAFSPEEMLNQSIEGLEYELVNAIQQVRQNSRKRIGYILGHNEPDSAEIAGFTNAVLEKYDLFKINLPDRKTPLTGYEVIIIAKPQKAFSEFEKYLLDQFVMKGGKLLLFIDALDVDIKKVDGEGTVAIPFNLNLTDLFFKYGFRINQDYIADVNCGNTPVVTGEIGNQPRVELLPWPYFPIISNYSDHPLVKNLDAIWMRGVATIDTVKADGIAKTPLFNTSEYTRIFTPPVVVSYNDLQEKLSPELFTSGVKSTAYMLEGKFTSLYKNRFPPKGINRNEVIEDGIDSKVVIVSDGDFIINEISAETGSPLQMGVDLYSQTTYANETFLLNALEYMMGDDKLMLARNREIKIRPLDKAKIQDERQQWISLNMLTPIVLLILFGLIQYILRKKKYTAK